jgi:hypothetical protein
MHIEPPSLETLDRPYQLEVGVLFGTSDACLLYTPLHTYYFNHYTAAAHSNSMRKKFLLFGHQQLGLSIQ